MSKKKYYEKANSEEQEHEEMEETTTATPIKIETVLLGVIALALIIQTFMMFSGNSDSGSPAYIQPGSNTGQPSVNNLNTNPQPNSQFQVNPAQANPDLPQPQNPTQTADPNQTTLSLSETTVDFGTVSAGQTKTHSFDVTNTGSQPLSYTNVRGDAGITISSYPTDPIAPGSSGKVDFSFDPAQVQNATGAQQSFNIHMDGNISHTHFTVQATVK